jgi:DNA glycosylase AlkZ-like
MTRLATGADVLAARLASQRLSGPPARSALEATRHLLAIQAQDPTAARLSIRARSRSRHASNVDHALNAGSLVITWANRGTLHLIAAEDEPLLHALTTPQLRTRSDRRLVEEGVTPALARRGVEAIAGALGADGPMTRGQIRALLDRAGVPTARQALVHVLFRATLDGLIVRGPMIDGEQAFVLASDWLGTRPRIERDRALAELARRYLVGHGPADERDLARWAEVTLRDARAGLQAIASKLLHRSDGLVELRGRKRRPLPPPRLLGPFDPLLLGWRSREFVIDRPQEAITSNGIIRAIALVKGRAAGTWTMPQGRVHLNLWEGSSEDVAVALTEEAAAVEVYLTSRLPR